MSDTIDLHLHSTCSDGGFSPAAVVEMAAGAGLAAIALADHDNIDGIDEARGAGDRLGIEVLSGVELSVVWEDFEDIHLLGYGFDHHHPTLSAALVEFQDFRARRNEMIVARVNERLAVEGRELIDFEGVRVRAGGTVGRPHIAMALREMGHVRNNEEAFSRYLVPCNVAKRYFPIADAIALLHEAGGVAVLAHPPFITPDRKVFTDLLEALIPLGLDGVEAWNSGSNNDEIDWYITAARRRGLLVTGGSDFHGNEEGSVRIGSGRGNLKIPYDCVTEIRKRLDR